MPIDRDLHELLYTHDLVIVPRFGGFLTHYRSARLDEQRRVIHPPSKDLSYNRNLTRTDGLLTDHVARTEGIDHQQANAVIEGEVDAWLSKLNRNNRLELSRIGTFYRDQEGNLQFDPDRKVNYLKDAFGLRTVSAVPLVANPVTPTADGPAEVRVLPLKPTEEATSERSFPWMWAAASVALLSAVATWWVVSSRGPNGPEVAGFDLFRRQEAAVYVPRKEPVALLTEEVDTASFVLPGELHGVHQVPIPGEESRLFTVDFGEAPPAADSSVTEPITVKVEPAEPESTAVKTRTVTARYHLIGGCFLLKDNADGFVADLQARGFAASIIDQKGGLYRVAYGSYPDRGLAEEALQAVRKEEAPEAWLLRR
jgi:hypothetical protein